MGCKEFAHFVPLLRHVISTTRMRAFTYNCDSYKTGHSFNSYRQKWQTECMYVKCTHTATSSPLLHSDIYVWEFHCITSQMEFSYRFSQYWNLLYHSFISVLWRALFLLNQLHKWKSIFFSYSYSCLCKHVCLRAYVATFRNPFFRMQLFCSQFNKYKFHTIVLFIGTIFPMLMLLLSQRCTNITNASMKPCSDTLYECQ